MVEKDLWEKSGAEDLCACEREERGLVSAAVAAVEMAAEE